MPVGPDEALTQAMSVEIERLRRTTRPHLHEIAERLHESHPHRSIEQIEHRLKLLLLSRGLFDPVALD